MDKYNLKINGELFINLVLHSGFLVHPIAIAIHLLWFGHLTVSLYITISEASSLLRKVALNVLQSATLCLG